MPHAEKLLRAAIAVVCFGLAGCGSPAPRHTFAPAQDANNIHAQLEPVEKPQRVAYVCEYKSLSWINLKRLGRKDPQERALAALALGGLFDPDTIEPLIEALRDKVPEVREAAQLALHSLTGQDIPKEDYTAWRAWWKANEKHMPDAAFVARKKEYMKALNANTVTLDSLSRRDPEPKGAQP
ncbi:MAG: HEAT repeat domain-containing protein [Planctomycetes bacterium]|nr:HEAT repeat domain-containing protein [Planctomycetota bacterium]